jgi:anti-anti-sigma factor
VVRALCGESTGGASTLCRSEVEQVRLGLSELFELPLPRKVALRLDHVSHISSRGIGILLAYFLRLERAGGALRLCELHSRVLSVLEQFRLTVLLEVCSTVSRRP